MAALSVQSSGGGTTSFVPRLDDGGLVARCQVRQFLAGPFLAQLLQLVEQARLEAGEAEVEVVSLLKGDGEIVALSVPALCSPLQRRSAGKAKAQHAGALVEGLAGGVVQGLPEEAHLTVGGDVVEG